MNDMKKNIRRIFFLFFALFAAVIGYLGYFFLYGSAQIITSPYNPRLKMTDDTVLRGTILDKNGSILAQSVKPDGEAQERQYPYGRELTHLVGTSQMGGSGIEARYYFNLQQPHMEMWQRLMNVISGEPVYANSIALTIDERLQNLIFTELSGQRSGAVVMEPSTGKILAMTSFPDYDPSRLGENWDDLKSDTDNSPLLNRATQGLYPPGSIFKVVTALAALEESEDTAPNEAEGGMPEADAIADFTYDCKGELKLDGYSMRCYDSKAHGVVDMKKAMAVSCNGYFAELGLKIGPEKLRQVSDRLNFNQTYGYALEYSKSSFVLDGGSTAAQTVQTAIGQGETLVTPLHMAMLASAVANSGQMMEPYVVNNFINYNGNSFGLHLPKSLGRLFSADDAAALRDMMTAVVDEGTGAPAAVKDVKIAAKTGTAENPRGDDHGWVIAFAPADEPKVAIAIVLENSGGPRKALQLVKKIVEQVMQE